MNIIINNKRSSENLFFYKKKSKNGMKILSVEYFHAKWRHICVYVLFIVSKWYTQPVHSQYIPNTNSQYIQNVQQQLVINVITYKHIHIHDEFHLICTLYTIGANNHNLQKGKCNKLLLFNVIIFLFFIQFKKKMKHKS